MPQISYVWVIPVVVLCSVLDYKVWEPFVFSILFITAWNYVPNFSSRFGFVSKHEYLKLKAKLDSKKVEGQDAVFNVYLFNKKAFQRHLELYMDRNDLEFNNKNKPKPKTTKWRNTLGVSEEASKEDVELAYKNLVKKYHPDVNKEEGNKERLVAINLAKEEADKHFG